MPGQFRRLKPVLLLTYLPVALLLGLFVVFKYVKNKPIRLFTADPNALADIPFYYGFLSNLGILCWSAAGAICLLSYSVVRRRSGKSEMSSFFLYSGILTFALAMDDLFQIHESFFPEYLHIEDKIVYLAYVVSGVYFLVRYRATILNSEYLLLLLALGFLATSMFLDFLPHDGEFHYLFEDGFKMFGIVSWLAYFSRFSWSSLGAAADGPA